jgi:hypothetical protein
MLSVEIYNGLFGLRLVAQQDLLFSPRLPLLTVLLLQVALQNLLPLVVGSLLDQKVGYLVEVELRMQQKGTLRYLVAVKEWLLMNQQWWRGLLVMPPEGGQMGSHCYDLRF